MTISQILRPQSTPGRRWILACCALAATAFSAGITHAQIYVLPTNYRPTDVSADGSAVTGEKIGPDNSNDTEFDQYFEWRSTNGGQRRAIGGVTAGNGIGGTPRISDDGSRITGTRRNPANQIPFGAGTIDAPEISYFDTATSTWTSLGGLGTSLGQGYSNGYGVSANGQHIVGSAWYVDPVVNKTKARAISWSHGDTAVTNLGLNGVDNSSLATAVSDDGTVIVGYQDGVGRNAAVWVNGVQTLVLTETTTANAVSGDGKFVVGGLWHSYPGDYNTNSRVDGGDFLDWQTNLNGPAATLQNDTDGGAIGQAQLGTWQANYGTGHFGLNAGGPNEAWRWSLDTGIEALGCLNNDCGNAGTTTAVFGQAVDVNYDGTVILGFDRGGGDFGIAGGDGWIWQEGIGQTGLRDYFVAEGLVLDADQINFDFGLPLAMSADERSFVGVGTDPDQAGNFGWIVTLPPIVIAGSSVPEPTTLLMAFVALAASWPARRSRGSY